MNNSFASGWRDFKGTFKGKTLAKRNSAKLVDVALTPRDHIACRCAGIPRCTILTLPMLDRVLECFLFMPKLCMLFMPKLFLSLCVRVVE